MYSYFLFVQGKCLATSTEHALIQSSVSEVVKPKLTIPRVPTVYKAGVPTVYRDLVPSVYRGVPTVHREVPTVYIKGISCKADDGRENKPWDKQYLLPTPPPRAMQFIEDNNNP